MSSDEINQLETELSEYDAQLQEIKALIEAEPDNAEYLDLEKDLLECINLTQESLDALKHGVMTEVENNHNSNLDVCNNSLPQEESSSSSTSNNSNKIQIHISSTSVTKNTEQQSSLEISNSTNNQTAADEKVSVTSKKKVSSKKELKKLSKKFEIPEGLVPLESDSVAEKNRKKRTIKALKSKHRERKKELESSIKKDSWQSFMKKNKSAVKKDSIWSSGDGDGKVGVVNHSSKY